jgi:hypothetical protein
LVAFSSNLGQANASYRRFVERVNGKPPQSQSAVHRDCGPKKPHLFLEIRSMFRKVRGVSTLETVVLGAVLLAFPCAMVAQHGGGRAGGGGVPGGGGGIDSGGRPNGVSEKDDLKDFHQALALQATSEQRTEFAAMLTSTVDASAVLQAFLEQLGKETGASELGRHGASLEEAVTSARTRNKAFLDGFSDRQKSGLKEITKRLAKADADLAAQAKALEQKIGEKAASHEITDAAQGLDQALKNFQSQQLHLGEGMGIEDPAHSQHFTYSLPPVTNSVKFENQSVAITTSGVISESVAESALNRFTIELTGDLADLQQNITEVLRAQLNTANPCGERVAIQNATLTPLGPAGVVRAELHFERWSCATALGKPTMSEMVEGNGTIEVRVTPAVAVDGTLRLVPEIVRIDAEGLVGDLLRSGSLGSELRDEISDSLLSTVRQVGDFTRMLPLAAQGNTTVHHARFQGTGTGRLSVVLDGEIHVSGQDVISLTSELKERSSPQGTMSR